MKKRRYLVTAVLQTGIISSQVIFANTIIESNTLALMKDDEWMTADIISVVFVGEGLKI